MSSAAAKPQCQVLIIGYGNTLRGDDGVGPKVAEAVEALGLPSVRTLARQQLTPELAEQISQAQLVIFVDATVDAPGKVRLRLLEPADTGQVMAHAADPRTLLALARDVFGHAPEGRWLTIPVAELGFSEELSEVARRGLQIAVEKIRQLCRQTRKPGRRGSLGHCPPVKRSRSRTEHTDDRNPPS